MKTKAIHTKDQSTVETYHEYAKRLYSLHQKNLQEFYQLGNNWDGYGSPSPNPTAITGAVNLLAELYSSGFIPHFTTPTIDNAVIIEVIKNGIHFRFRVIDSQLVCNVRMIRGSTSKTISNDLVSFKTAVQTAILALD
jgi:hypothetical protein